MKSKNKRKFIRFQPDQFDVAFVEFSPSERAFNPSHVALILDEAHGGCGLVITLSKKPRKGDLVRVKVGKLSPLIGDLVWVKKLTDHVYQIGIEYKE